MPRQLAQQWMTYSDLEWPFRTSCAAEPLVEYLLQAD